MEQAILTGSELAPQPYWLGTRVILIPLYFREYTAGADRVMQLLRLLVKDTHKLERRISFLGYFDQPDLREAVELQVKIDEILRSRGLSAGETLRRIRQIVAQTREYAIGLLEELEGEHGA